MLLAAGLVLGGSAAFDLARVPEKQLSARGADVLIGAYQATVSPLFEAAGARCRFVPSCSEYARATIRDRGLAAGGLRTLARLARCGPWTPSGTVDPVSGRLPSARPTTGARTGTLAARECATRVLAPGEERAAKRRPR